MGIYPSLPQFVIKPSSLLLEDQRSSTSRKKNNSRGLCLFVILKKEKYCEPRGEKTFLYEGVYLLYPFKATLMLLNHNNITSAKITDEEKFRKLYLEAVYICSWSYKRKQEQKCPLCLNKEFSFYIFQRTVGYKENPPLVSSSAYLSHSNIN